MRNITVINNGVAKFYETNASTFGQLKEIAVNDFPAIDQMQGVVRGLEVTLQINSAQLPEGDATIFLMPKKTESGADDVSTWNRSRCYEYIKAARIYNEDAKEFFGTYSSRSTGELREMIMDYIESDNDSFSLEEVVEMLNVVHGCHFTVESIESDMLNYTRSKEVLAEESDIRKKFGIR